MGTNRTRKTNTKILNNDGKTCRDNGQKKTHKQALKFKPNLLQYVQRMGTNTLPKQALKYKIKFCKTYTGNGQKQNTITSIKINKFGKRKPKLAQNVNKK